MAAHTCANCKHYRWVDFMTRDGDIVYSGYCHACGTFPEKKPDDTCKRFTIHPEILGQ